MATRPCSWWQREASGFSDCEFFLLVYKVGCPLGMVMASKEARWSGVPDRSVWLAAVEVDPGPHHGGGRRTFCAAVGTRVVKLGLGAWVEADVDLVDSGSAEVVLMEELLGLVGLVLVGWFWVSVWAAAEDLVVAPPRAQLLAEFQEMGGDVDRFQAAAVSLLAVAAVFMAVSDAWADAVGSGAAVGGKILVLIVLGWIGCGPSLQDKERKKKKKQARRNLVVDLEASADEDVSSVSIADGGSPDPKGKGKFEGCQCDWGKPLDDELFF